MKVLLLAVVLAAVYTAVMLGSANVLLSSTEQLHRTYNQVSDATAAWQNGDTSVSLVPTTH